MGFALSWLAIKSKDSAAIRRELQFEETSEKEEFPESDLTAIQLGEWYIIVGNGDWYVNLYNLNFAELSKRRQLVFCNIDERVMFSLMTWWENEKLKCEVTHESAKGNNHLDEVGDFPPQYSDIKNQQVAAQREEEESGRNEVDYIIDIPAELAHSLVGYRHDVIISQEEPLFTVLNHNPILKPKQFGGNVWVLCRMAWKKTWYHEVKKKWW